MSSDGDLNLTVVLSASIAINVCVALATIVTSFVGRCISNGNQSVLQRSRQTHRSLTEIIFSCSCCAGGLYLLTSQKLWMYPFDINDPTGRSRSDDASLIVLSAALGRFLCSFAILLNFSAADCSQDQNMKRSLQSTQRGSSWAVFRGIYIITNIVCLSTIVHQRTNYLVGAVILLLEADQMFEEVKRVWNRRHVSSSSIAKFKRCRVILITVGFLLVGLRIVLPVTLVVIAATRVQNVLRMDPVNIGITCFSVVFYTISAVFMLRRQLNYMSSSHPNPIQNPEDGNYFKLHSSEICHRIRHSRTHREVHQHHSFPSNSVVNRNLMQRGKMRHICSSLSRVNNRWRACSKAAKLGLMINSCDLLAFDFLMTNIKLRRRATRLTKRKSCERSF